MSLLILLLSVFSSDIVTSQNYTNPPQKPPLGEGRGGREEVMEKAKGVREGRKERKRRGGNIMEVQKKSKGRSKKRGRRRGSEEDKGSKHHTVKKPTCIFGPKTVI